MLILLILPYFSSNSDRAGLIKWGLYSKASSTSPCDAHYRLNCVDVNTMLQPEPKCYPPVIRYTRVDCQKYGKVNWCIVGWMLRHIVFRLAIALDVSPISSVWSINKVLLRTWVAPDQGLGNIRLYPKNMIGMRWNARLKLVAVLETCRFNDADIFTCMFPQVWS